MAVKIPTNQVQDLQQIEVVVAGPDGANRLFLISGRIVISHFAQSNSANSVQQKETFLILMGPVLTRRQFIRGNGTTALTNVQYGTQTSPSTFAWGVNVMDVDWDDESGQVELRIEVSATSAGTNNHVSLSGASFQVMILAELAAQ